MAEFSGLWMFMVDITNQLMNVNEGYKPLMGTFMVPITLVNV